MTKYIFLSPHLDDAILSCGGWIWELLRNENKVAIWTVFAGLPEQVPDLAKSFFKVASSTEAREYVMMRWAEDSEAMQVLGVRDYVRLTFLDAPFREGGFEKKPAGLVGEISLTIRRLMRPASDKVLVIPYAIGNHIDHSICRTAAELAGVPFLYYADFPYVQHNTRAWRNMKLKTDPFEINISPEGFEYWRQSVLKYRSQIPLLFVDKISLFDFYRVSQFDSIRSPRISELPL